MGLARVGELEGRGHGVTVEMTAYDSEKKERENNLVNNHSS